MTAKAPENPLEVLLNAVSDAIHRDLVSWSDTAVARLVRGQQVWLIDRRLGLIQGRVLGPSVLDHEWRVRWDDGFSWSHALSELYLTRREALIELHERLARVALRKRLAFEAACDAVAEVESELELLS